MADIPQLLTHSSPKPPLSMKLSLFCLFFCFASSQWVAQAQTANNFTSDRPGLANTPLVVGKHYLQMQFGGRFGQYFPDAWGASYDLQEWQQDYLFRFGVNKKTEIDFGFSLLKTNGVPTNAILPAIYTPYLRYSHPTRLNGLQAGLRHTFFTENERDFSLGMLLIGKTNYGSWSGRLDQFGYVLGLLGAKQISRRISATGNIGFQHKSSFTGPELFYVVNFAFDLGNNLGVFVETKNESVLLDRPDMVQWFNSGLYWKITPNFMLDLHGGNSRDVGSAFYGERYWYAALGLSWKIKAIATKKPVAP